MKTVERREFREFKRTQKQALRLQAKEYERRLKHLNGEQARIAAAAATSVRKDLYDADAKTVDTRMKSLEGADQQRTGALRLIGLLAAGGAVTGVIGMVGLMLQWIKVPAAVTSPPQVYYVPASPGTMIPQTQQQAPPR